MLQPQHLLADGRAAALNPHARAHKLLAEEVRFGIDQLAAGVIVNAQRRAMLPVGRLVDAVAGRVQRTVDRHIALARGRAPFGHPDLAAKVQRLPVVGEAGDRVVDDDLDLSPLRPRREERMALPLRDPELILLAAELGHQRRPEQQQQREMRHKRGELGPAKAVGEEIDCAVGRAVRLAVGLSNPLNAVAARAQRRAQRGGALIG